MGFPHLPKLGTNLVTALSDLDVDDLSHDARVTSLDDRKRLRNDTVGAKRCRV
jgi:hypothetical protein